MKILAGLLIFWTTLAAAADQRCQTILRSQPLGILVGRIFENRLDQVSTYTLRFTFQGAGDANLKDLEEHFEARGLRMKLMQTSEAGPHTNIDVEVSGLGRHIISSLMELEDLHHVSWMAAPTRKQVARTSAIPTPSGEALRAQLLLPLISMNLSRRSFYALYKDGMRFVGDLVQRKWSEMKTVSGIGRMSLREVQRAVAQRGLSFGMKIDGWPYPEIDPILSQFTERETIPIFSLTDWLARTGEQAISLFPASGRGLGVRRPIALMKMDDRQSIGIIEGDYWDSHEADAITEYIDAYTYGRLAAADKRTLRMHLQKLKPRPIKTVSLESTLGESGRNLFGNMIESGVPAAVEESGQKIVFIAVPGPYLPAFRR